MRLVVSDVDGTLVDDDKRLHAATIEAVGRLRAQGLSRASELTARATIAKSQPYVLDVTALEANKGAAITWLTEAMDVPLSATAAIGDQANDIPMVTRAGLSIVMAQRPRAVRDTANFVTASNETYGVAFAIDEMILPSLTRNGTNFERLMRNFRSSEATEPRIMQMQTTS